MRSREGSPFVFEPAAAAMDVPGLYGDPDTAARIAVVYEAMSFLKTVGYGQADGIVKTLELLPSLNQVATEDGSAILITFDGSALRLFVSRGEDYDRLEAAEHQAVELGHSVYTAIVSRFRDYLAEEDGQRCRSISKPLWSARR